jgi:hypothetical protein
MGGRSAPGDRHSHDARRGSFRRGRASHEAGGLLTAIGIVAGVAGALGLNRLIGSLRFGIRPTDPTTIGVVVAMIATVGRCRLRAPSVPGVAARPKRGAERGMMLEILPLEAGSKDSKD